VAIIGATHTIQTNFQYTVLTFYYYSTAHRSFTYGVDNINNSMKSKQVS